MLPAGMGEGMKEAAKKRIEEEVANKAPASIKPLFPCCGGPVLTTEKCICMVAENQQDDVKKAIEEYKKLWGACYVCLRSYLWLYTEGCK